jgi:hypothetical protein
MGSLLLAAVFLSGCSRGDGGEQEEASGDARRFVAVESVKSRRGVVLDLRTRLSWTASDTRRELTWHEAEQHCQGLDRGESGVPWRLATADELFALYDENASQSCGMTQCRIDPAIALTSPFQWASTAPSETRRIYVDFAHGSRLAPILRTTLTRRALCARTS